MKNTPTQTEINCRHNTAAFIFILIGCLFCSLGCTQIYRTLGMSEEQIAAQVANDQESLQNILNAGRIQLHDIIVTIIAGSGTILSGLLAKWLGTERKITTAMIKGIEAGENPTVKEAVHTKATAAGVEPILHARVVALT